METVYFSSEPSRMRITSIHYDRVIDAFVVQAQDGDSDSEGVSLSTLIDIPCTTKGNVAASKKLIEELKLLSDALPGFWTRYPVDMQDDMLTRDILPVFGYLVEWWATRDNDHDVIVDGYRCPGHYLWSLTPGQSVTIVPRPDTDVIPSSVRSNLHNRVVCQTFDTMSRSNMASDV